VKLGNRLLAAPPNCSFNELQVFGMSEARSLGPSPRSDNAVKKRDQLNIESPYLNSPFRDSHSDSPASYR